jgi:hypothetical protein
MNLLIKNNIMCSACSILPTIPHLDIVCVLCCSLLNIEYRRWASDHSSSAARDDVRYCGFVHYLTMFSTSFFPLTVDPTFLVSRTSEARYSFIKKNTIDLQYVTKFKHAQPNAEL